MSKLSWDPPKWESYDFDGIHLIVKLETGKIFKGKRWDNHIKLDDHQDACIELFGAHLGSKSDTTKISELAQVLDLNLKTGFWPVYFDVKEFLKRYYERIAKIKNSDIFKIYLETEFNITPKFTL